MFAPILPRPIIPSCMIHPLGALVIGLCFATQLFAPRMTYNIVEFS